MSSFLRLLAHLCRLSHSHNAPPPRNEQNEGGEVHLCLAEALVQLEALPSEIDPSPTVNPGTPPENLVDAIRCLQPFLPAGCELLGQGDLKIAESRPIDAGSFVDVWAGKRNDGTAVVIKSPRCHSSSSCLPAYLRLYQEALTCSRLNDNGKAFVSFVGVYATREHPFALVFTFMDHSNLRGYLRNNQDVGRLELLLDIARGLKYMHGLGMVHGNLKITNVLVGGDGRARIAGLGMAFVPPAIPASGTGRSFRIAAIELIGARRCGFSDATATVASDVYAFAILACEVFTGKPPFSDESVIAGAYSMLNGRRPARPDHRELSDRMWKTIASCWKSDPAKRKTMDEVVTILEAELNAPKVRTTRVIIPSI